MLYAQEKILWIYFQKNLEYGLFYLTHLIEKKNTDLASEIKKAYNLHNLRKPDHPDFLFVVTDAIFSLSETKK